jgi:glucosamine 6-phosphate synthetase-like amidotransferase/phosphosugar isomerase protein
MIAAKRGSPLILGIKRHDPEAEFNQAVSVHQYHRKNSLIQSESIDNLSVHLESINLTQVEYLLASDINALIEHTSKVLYLEDGDIVHFHNGDFTFYSKKDQATGPDFREIVSVDMELAEISKGLRASNSKRTKAILFFFFFFAHSFSFFSHCAQQEDSSTSC